MQTRNVSKPRIRIRWKIQVKVQRPSSGLGELRSFHGLEDLERLSSLTVLDAAKVTSFYGLDSLYDLQFLTLQSTPDFCTDYLETFLQRFVPRPVLTTDVTDWAVPCR